MPKILESPWIKDPEDKNKSCAPYKYEIDMLRTNRFDPHMTEKILAENRAEASGSGKSDQD